MMGKGEQFQDSSNISNTTNDEKTHDEQQRDEEKVYPPKKVVLPAMAAVYLAVFLVALVRFYIQSISRYVSGRRLTIV
jgi:hypothetical protein